jgi:ATP-binding cassette subfamily B protein
MPRDLDALSRTTGRSTATRATLLRIWRLIWPADALAFRLRLGATIGLLALAALINALVPLLFARVIDRFTLTPVVVTAPLALLLAYVGLQWLGRLFNELRWALYGPIEQRLRRRLALHALEHLHGLSLGFHLSRRTGQVSHVMDEGLKAMRELLFDSVFLILPLLCEMLFVTSIMLLKVEPVFALILATTLAVYGVALVVGSEWLRAHQRRAVAESAAAHGTAIDSLLNYETVKYFNNEAHIAERYDRGLAKVERLTVRALAFRSFTGFILVSIIAAGMAAILLLAAGRVAAGTMTVGGLVLVNAYLLQLIRPMERLGQLYRSLKQAFTDLEQLLELLDEKPEIRDRKGAYTLPPGPGSVLFDEVSFAYGPGRTIVKGLSFRLPAGHKLALVGPTGAGKSTVARLLFRFYDPTSGRVLFDGHDLRDLTQDSLRAAIAVVPQDTVLFNDTIGYNIAFGRPDATKAEIESAARAAALHDFITSLPDGYDTLVGERGLKLSGGEKQRVAIARAVLKRPRLFILDEATSALDSATERAIQANLREICRGTTTLVIAHRLSTIVDADEILVLDEGRLVERGTHAELLRRRGLYAKLWRRQAAEAGLAQARGGLDAQEPVTGSG